MDQKQIAHKVVDLLSRTHEFSSVSLGGSLATNTHDSMSDIDILIESEHRSDIDNVLLASQMLGKEFETTLSDWAGSLLPEKCLMSLFIAGVPLFWWIDLGCMHSPRFPPTMRQDLPVNTNDHVAKLWVMNAKYYLRHDTAKLRLDHLYRRLFGERAAPENKLDAFKDIHAAIDFSRIRPAFESGCQEIWCKLEATV